MRIRQVGAFAILASLSLLVGVSGCAPSLNDLEGFPCADDKTCPSGFSCVADRCMRGDAAGGSSDTGADTNAVADAGADATTSDTNTSVDANDGGQDVTTADVGPDAPTVTPEIVVAPQTGLSTIESGTTATFSISLTVAPKANVTIAVTSSDTAEVSVSPSSVEFTTANWSTPKVVTLTGVDDAVSDGPKIVTITTAPAVSTDSAYSGLNPDDVTVTNVDNDTAGFAVSPTSGLSVSETGTSATFTVALVTKPTADVTIPLSSSALTAATVSPSSLTFTATNYATPQTVTVTGVDDPVVDGTQNFTIVLGAATSADTAYNSTNPVDVTGSTLDNDVAGVTVSPTTGLSVSETGTTATFTVVLRAAPSANVTVPVSSSDLTEATASPASLVFTSSNWSTPQTVTTTGVDDAVADGPQNFTIVLGAATSADAAYNGFNPTDVTGSTTDDDVAGIVAPTAPISLTEGAANATFTVSLRSAPTANVTIPVSISDPTAATVSPSSLTFTAVTYATPQTVTLTPVDDGAADGTQSFAVVFGTATSTDPAYSGVKAPDITGTTVDNDSGVIGLAAAGTPIMGGYHACIRSTAGAVKCWGKNSSGQLGQGDMSDRGDATGEMGASLAAVQLGTGRTASALTLGLNHVCVILDNSQVKCWGYNSNGELGLGNTNNRGDVAGEMGDSLATTDLGAGRTAKAIAARDNHTCAILDNDQLKCWGANTSGQLGLGDTSARGNAAGEMGDSLPAVNLGTGRTAKAVAVGETHTCAILDNNQVKCWGGNVYGELGQGDTASRGDGAGEMGDSLPTVNLGTGRTATAIAAGWTHTCVILDNGGVKCWGYNRYGKLGLGDLNNRGDAASEMGDSLPAIDFGTGRTALFINAAWNHTCAILDNYTAKCWGANSNGDLGLGDTANRGDTANEMGDNLPAISIGTGRSFRSISGGVNNNCARLDDGRSKCWGYNTNGQLGLGDLLKRGDGAGEMGDSLAFLDWVP